MDSQTLRTMAALDAQNEYMEINEEVEDETQTQGETQSHTQQPTQVTNTGRERKVREATDAVSEEVKKKCLMRLSWALVRSRQTEDVQRGIAMLEDGVITATAFGFIAGVIVAALARKK